MPVNTEAVNKKDFFHALLFNLGVLNVVVGAITIITIVMAIACLMK